MQSVTGPRCLPSRPEGWGGGPGPEGGQEQRKPRSDRPARGAHRAVGQQRSVCRSASGAGRRTGVHQTLRCAGRCGRSPGGRGHRHTVCPGPELRPWHQPQGAARGSRRARPWFSGTEQHAEPGLPAAVGSPDQLLVLVRGASYAPGRAHRARRPQALPAAAAAALSLQVILGPAWARGPAAGDPGLARLGVIISKEMKQGGAAGSEEGRAASCPCSQLAASPLPPSVDRGRPWPADVLASLCYRDLRPAPTPSATLRPAALLLSALPAGCHGNRGRGCSGTETDLSKRRPVPVPPPRGGRGEAPGREPHAGEPGPGWGPGHGFRQALPRPSAQGV